MCPNVPRTTATPLGKPAVVSSLIAGDGNRCRRRFHSLRSSAVGRRAGSPYKCTCTTNGIAHRRSPSVGYLPAHRRRCPQLSSPSTRQQWNAPVNIAVGKAPHHAVCRSGGHLALCSSTCIRTEREWRKTAMRLAVPRVIESTDRPFFADARLGLCV